MATKNVTKKTTNTTKNKTKSATKSTAKSAAYNSRNTTKNNPNPAGKKKKRRRRRKKKTGLVVMIATGVAKPSAQGQLITKTEIALESVAVVENVGVAILRPPCGIALRSKVNLVNK